jgi:uncharacterized protein YjgD (DUF1641 family)
MSADELANSLVFQENLNKLGDASRKQLEDKVDALKKAGQIDEANRLMAAAGSEKEAQDALFRVDAQTHFNQGMERLQAIIGSMLEGPGQGFVNLLASAVSHAEALKNIFIGVVSVMAGMKAMQLTQNIMNAVRIKDEGKILGLMIGQATSAAIINPLATVAIGLAAAAAVGGLIYSSMKGHDVMSAGEGTGYGKRTLLMNKNAIQLNNKDTVIAGTNLFGGKQNQSTTVDNSSLIAEIRSLRNDMNSRPVVLHSIVQLPNGEAIARSTNSENRKGHYGVQ